MGNARNAPKDTARAGRVAAIAESRRRPGPDSTDRQHSRDMAKINKHVEGQNK
jgi:hypothetical protein